jgi:ribosomal-protein-alanine N-acetyltransferase
MSRTLRRPSPPKLDPPRGGISDGTVSLRAWRRRDVPSLVEICQDPDIPRWTVVPSPYSESDAHGFLLAQAERRAGGEAAPFAIVKADDRDAVLGSIEVTLQDWRNGRGEVGYWVASWARGQGVARRAVLLVSRWAFEDLGLSRLELLVEPGNDASQRVAESAGFTREGMLRSYREMKGRRVDFICYSLLPDDPLPEAD